jgi:hypothetical protein
LGGKMLHQSICKMGLFMVLCTFLQACQPPPTAPQETQPKPKSSPTLTDEQWVEKAESCQHFANEFNGDHSERDKQLITTLDELNCGEVDVHIDEISNRLEKNSPLMERITMLRAEQ